MNGCAARERSEGYEDVVARIDLQDRVGHQETLDERIGRSDALGQGYNLGNRNSRSRFDMIESSRE